MYQLIFLQHSGNNLPVLFVGENDLECFHLGDWERVDYKEQSTKNESPILQVLI